MKKIQLFADGIRPDKEYMDNIMDSYGIVGYTCNPTLIKQYLPMTYKEYCSKTIEYSRNYPVSIQVLSSDLNQIYEEAKIINSWGSNIYVKIPVITENSEKTKDVILQLIKEKIKVNVTSIFTPEQVKDLKDSGLKSNTDCILSVFSGRISDTGLVPNDIIKQINSLFSKNKNIKLLWAGVRSSLDIYLASKYCDIITLPQSIVDKLKFKQKDLNEYTLETVKMFANDSKNFNLS